MEPYTAAIIVDQVHSVTLPVVNVTIVIVWCRNHP